jgi:hypothetical protein
MSKSRLKVILVCAASLLIGVLLFVRPRKEVPVCLVYSSQNEAVAVVAYRDSILGTYGADIVVVSNEHTIARTCLLRSRDCIEDVAIEFPNIEIKGREVILGGTGVHYKGTRQFQIDSLVAGSGVGDRYISNPFFPGREFGKRSVESGQTLQK